MNDPQKKNSGKENNNNSNKENSVSANDHKKLSRQFKPGRYVWGSVTWLICTALIIPCYVVTKIWVMAAMVPVFLLLSLAFLYNGLYTRVTIEGDKLMINENKLLTKREKTINLDHVKSIVAYVSFEQEEEIIHQLQVRTNDDIINLPDIDEKNRFIEFIEKQIPGIQIEKKDKYNSREKKALSNLSTVAAVLGILGMILAAVLLPANNPYEKLINFLKGLIIGGGAGFIIWFVFYNLKNRSRKKDVSAE